MTIKEGEWCNTFRSIEDIITFTNAKYFWKNSAICWSGTEGKDFYSSQTWQPVSHDVDISLLRRLSVLLQKIDICSSPSSGLYEALHIAWKVKRKARITGCPFRRCQRWRVVDYFLLQIGVSEHQYHAASCGAISTHTERVMHAPDWDIQQNLWIAVEHPTCHQLLIPDMW